MYRDETCRCVRYEDCILERCIVVGEETTAVSARHGVGRSDAVNALKANGFGASVMHGVRGDVRRAGGVKDMRRFESRYRRSYGSQSFCFLYVYRLIWSRAW